MRGVPSFLCVCVCVSDLEVLPVIVLVLFTVCDDDSWIIGSSGQTLVVLHQLVGLIDTEQLQTKTKKPHTRLLKSSETGQKTYHTRQFHYLVAPHPVARPYFHTSPIVVPHTVNAVAGVQTTDLPTSHGSEGDTTASKVSETSSVCVCVGGGCSPRPIPNSSEAKGNAAGCRRLFPPWTTWSSYICVPPWQQDSQFYLQLN